MVWSVVVGGVRGVIRNHHAEEEPLHRLLLHDYHRRKGWCIAMDVGQVNDAAETAATRVSPLTRKIETNKTIVVALQLHVRRRLR